MPRRRPACRALTRRLTADPRVGAGDGVHRRRAAAARSPAPRLCRSGRQGWRRQQPAVDRLHLQRGGRQPPPPAPGGQPSPVGRLRQLPRSPAHAHRARPGATPGTATRRGDDRRRRRSAVAMTAGAPVPRANLASKIRWPATASGVLVKPSVIDSPSALSVGRRATQASSRTVGRDPRRPGAGRPASGEAPHSRRGWPGRTRGRRAGRAARTPTVRTAPANAGRKVSITSTVQAMPIAQTGPRLAVGVRARRSSRHSRPRITVAAEAAIGRRRAPPGARSSRRRGCRRCAAPRGSG